MAHWTPSAAAAFATRCARPVIPAPLGSQAGAPVGFPLRPDRGNLPAIIDGPNGPQFGELIRQPDWTRLGLGSADEAEGRN